MKILPAFILIQAFTAIAAIQDAEVASSTAEALPERRVEIIFVHEPNQKEFLSAVGEIMERLERKGIQIDYQNIPSSRQNAQTMQDLFCQLGVKGLSIVIDVTLSGCNAVRDLMQSHLIPYFNFDYSIQSFVRAMELYLSERRALNAVFILQDEAAAEEAIIGFSTKSSLRTISLDQLPVDVVGRLKTLRPTPSFFVIIADSSQMERLFRIADEAGLVSRLADRWNLMFTDFNGEGFEHFEYPEMSRLLLNRTVCCNPECICTSQASLKAEALSSFLSSVLAVLEENDFLFRKFACNEVADVPAQRARKLLDDLTKTIEANSFIFVDEKKIWQNLQFDVRTGATSNATEIETTASVAMREVRAIGNHQIKTVNRFLRVGVTESVPYTFYKRDPKTREVLRGANNLPIYEGFCIDLINEIARKMNFSYELVEPSSGKFGDRLDDGSFDGLVGDLIRGETDLIVSALKMTAVREEQIDFIAPFFDQTGILIVMKKPTSDTSLFKFMTVLRLEVWLSILGALVITAFVIWILEIFSPYSSRNWSYDEPCRKFTLRESVWFSLCSFTPQGGGEAPKALSGRVIVAAYWLFVVLMLATFTANLAAFLTVERMQSPVQSLDQLSRQSRINYTVVNGSDTHQYFKNMKHAEDKLYELWKETTLSATSDESKYRVWDYPIKETFGSILMAIENSKPLPNADEGFRIVNEQETNDFAFIHDANEIKYELSRNCNYSVVGEVFAEQPYAIAVQQGSLLQDEISRVILELQKARFFEDLTAKYWNQTLKGACTNNDDSEGISLESLGGVFIATLVGLALAMMVLAGEVFYYKRKTKKAIAATSKVTPFESSEYSTQKIRKSVLLGLNGEFVPIERKPRLSFISVHARE